MNHTWFVSKKFNTDLLCLFAKEKPEQQEEKHRVCYEYEDLVIHLRKHIDKEFGGVANFRNGNV